MSPNDFNDFVYWRSFILMSFQSEYLRIIVFQIRIYFPPNFELHFEVKISSIYFSKGVLHTSRVGGPCAAIAQRDAAV